MTQNNEREAFEAHMVKTFGKGINLNRESEWVDENTTTGLIYLSENVEFAWHGWQARAQSPISQNDQHEVVAYADASLVCTISTYMIKELESRNETNKFPYHLWPTKLYTSPKQIHPSEWVSVVDRLPEFETDVLITGLLGRCRFYDIAGLFGESEYEWFTQSTANKPRFKPTYWMPLPEAPPTRLTSETNTEVGND